jgi:hypothetical protein
MTKIILSTVRRHVLPTEPSGCFYVVDLEQQRVLQRCEMIEPPYREVDTNPRGGLRGSRGIAVLPDQIFVTDATAVFRYDSKWNLLGMISHPSCSAIHDILVHEDTLWVTSARNDLVLCFSIEGNLLSYYYLRDPSPASMDLGWKPPHLIRPSHILNATTDFRNPLTHLEEAHDHAHVNSVAFLSTGETLVSLGLLINLRYATLLWLKSKFIRYGIWDRFVGLNRKIREAMKLKKDLHSDLLVQPAKARSAIWHLSKDGDHSLSLAIAATTVPSHSLNILHDDTAVYLDTTHGCIIHFNPASSEIYSSTVVTDGFLRGVTQLSDRKLLLGSKGELIIFDLPTLRVEQTFKISDVPHEAVYDIKVFPSHFSMPPESFERHFTQTTGHRARDLIHAGGIIAARDVIKI